MSNDTSIIFFLSDYSSPTCVTHYILKRERDRTERGALFTAFCIPSKCRCRGLERHQGDGWNHLPAGEDVEDPGIKICSTLAHSVL